MRWFAGIAYATRQTLLASFHSTFFYSPRWCVHGFKFAQRLVQVHRGSWKDAREGWINVHHRLHSRIQIKNAVRYCHCCNNSIVSSLPASCDIRAKHGQIVYKAINILSILLVFICAHSPRRLTTKWMMHLSDLLLSSVIHAMTKGGRVLVRSKTVKLTSFKKAYLRCINWEIRALCNVTLFIKTNQPLLFHLERMRCLTLRRWLWVTTITHLFL